MESVLVLLIFTHIFFNVNSKAKRNVQNGSLLAGLGALYRGCL